MTVPTDIDLAAYAYQQAKAAEEHARSARLEAEAHLISLVGLKGDEGTKSTKTGWYKVTTTAKLTRTIDREKAGALRAHLNEDLFYSVFVPDVKLSVSALKQVASADPDTYRLMLGAIVTKPAKPSVAVALLEQEAA